MHSRTPSCLCHRYLFIQWLIEYINFIQNQSCPNPTTPTIQPVSIPRLALLSCLLLAESIEIVLEVDKRNIATLRKLADNVLTFWPHRYFSDWWHSWSGRMYAITLSKSTIFAKFCQNANLLQKKKLTPAKLRDPGTKRCEKYYSFWDFISVCIYKPNVKFLA